MKCAVVGAGVVGSAIAYQLAAHGADVTVVDGALPGSGVTSVSFAWIGHRTHSASPAATLRYAAVQEWHRVETEVAGLRLAWCGSVTWGDSAVEDGTAWSPDFRELEPRLRARPALAQIRPDDGAVDPVEAAQVFVSAAAGLGARVILGDPVIEVTRTHGRIDGVRTRDAAVAADTVVLANGTGAVGLCDRLGLRLPVRAGPAVLFRYTARPGIVRGILDGGDFGVRQLHDGTLLSPRAYSGETTTARLHENGTRVGQLIQRSFDDIGLVELVSATIGWRPMPEDEEPIIGPALGLDGLYLAVMHSGVTLAAAAARFAAAEIITGRPRDELAGCRLPRH